MSEKRTLRFEREGSVVEVDVVDPDALERAARITLGIGDDEPVGDDDLARFVAGALGSAAAT